MDAALMKIILFCSGKQWHADDMSIHLTGTEMESYFNICLADLSFLNRNEDIFLQEWPKERPELELEQGIGRHDQTCSTFGHQDCTSRSPAVFFPPKVSSLEHSSWIPRNLSFRYILFHEIRLQRMLWHHNARVNLHQRWKQMQFHLCLLSSLVWIDSGVVVSQHRLEYFFFMK